MDDETYTKKHTRQVTFAGDADYQPTKILETLKGDKKPFACILEHVFSASFISLYVFKI